MRTEDQTRQLVEAVKAHARRNYDRGGWDYIVEAYEDSEIVEVIGNATTARGAIWKAGQAVGVRAEVRRDVQGA